MTCFELTTDTPEEMITLLRGLNLEATKDEPMREVQEETPVHDGKQKQLQAEEGLGKAPEKAAADEDFIETFAEAIEELANEQTAENRMMLIQAAKVIRYFRDYLQASTSDNVDLALNLLNICRATKREEPV